jgi:hypothetical protein
MQARLDEHRVHDIAPARESLWDNMQEEQFTLDRVDPRQQIPDQGV